ncbi:hypothetical protein CEXT_382081 [Caerostris extrusa]|uniref:Uncharacterized protein n=1 Tax=Caerostris extrusa TaxID=172846 RepID=A0AAV4VGY1_CAEEX|nr:hypothetical protein CEXT_382081 [Caerostris extrusa]
MISKEGESCPLPRNGVLEGPEEDRCPVARCPCTTNSELMTHVCRNFRPRSAFPYLQPSFPATVAVGHRMEHSNYRWDSLEKALYFSYIIRGRFVRGIHAHRF